MSHRWLVPILFAAVAVATAVAVALTPDAIWRSILAGVATTAVAAAVADGIALLDRRREQKPIRQLVGRRIGRVHQLVLDITTTVFDDVEVSDARALPGLLRQLSDEGVDFSADANVFPPATRRQKLSWTLHQFDEVMSELAVLATTGVLGAEVDRADVASRSPFIGAVRAGVDTGLDWNDRIIPAKQAADLIEELQSILPAAAEAAGSTWRFGSV